MLNSIKSQIASRLESPLLLSFSISWLTLNHKYFIILFSGDSIQSRLDLARDTCFPDWNSVIMNGLIIPSIGAVLYIIFYPLLNKLAFTWWEGGQISLKKKKLKLAEQMPVNQEEHNKLVAEYHSMESKQNEEIADLRSENSKLKNQYNKAIDDRNILDKAIDRAHGEKDELISVKERLTEKIELLQKALTTSKTLTKDLQTKLDKANLDSNKLMKFVSQENPSEPELPRPVVPSSNNPVMSLNRPKVPPSQTD